MRALTFAVVLTVAAIIPFTAVAQIGVKPKTDFSLKGGSDAKFHVGDVWEYKTRLSEEKSRVTIVKIDESPELGVIIHVAVDNVTFKLCDGSPLPESIPHMPFSLKAIEASVTKKVGSAQSLPDYRDGYDEWRAAFSDKKAGVYVIQVGDAVSVAEQTYRTGIGCGHEGNKESSAGF